MWVTTFSIASGIVGMVPTAIGAGAWARRYIFHLVSWNETYQRVDRTINDIRRDHPDFAPDAIIAVGFGGQILARYLCQFFPGVALVGVDAQAVAASETREISRSKISRISGSKFLIVSGISDTGFTLATVCDVLKERAPDQVEIVSYAFWYKGDAHPNGRGSKPEELLHNQDIGADMPWQAPDYFSIASKRAHLPWYRTRVPNLASDVGANSESVWPLDDGGLLIEGISVDLQGRKSPLELTSPVVVAALADVVRAAADGRKAFNVVIAGPAGIGKSRLAVLLAQHLGKDATYLPLDSSVRDTADRDNERVNGCQSSAYNWDDAQQWLNLLEEGKQFTVSPYDHAVRSKVGTLLVEGVRRFRIIEWVFANSDRCNVKRDLTIVLDAPMIAKHRFWLERFTGTRRMQESPELIDVIGERLKATEVEIAPTLAQWDVRFLVNESRVIVKIDSKFPLFSNCIRSLLANLPKPTSRP